MRLWELTRPANPAPLAIEIALGPFYGTAAICYTTSMIPVRAPQDVTTLLRSMFAAVTPPRCESSSPHHSTSTSTLPRHSPSVPALAPQPSSPTSCRCRLPHPASPCTRVYTIAPAGRGHTLYGSLRLPTLLNWLNPSPPTCCLASHCRTYDCGRSAMIARGPTPDTGILQDTAGYCGILLDTGRL